MATRRALASLLGLLGATSALAAQSARDLGVPFEGSPGKFNAITDVAGVAVGHTTLIEGEGRLQVGVGPIRTGVTVILPRGRSSDTPEFAGVFALNGTGEMTGASYIEEYGLLEGPIALTNSQSVGTVRDAIGQWLASTKKWTLCCLPVVAETYDGNLNDIHGFHVKARHVIAALESAHSGPVAQGNVGGGTGMIAYGFKAGIGSASRIVAREAGGYTVGVLVQANMGRREQLRIAGVPVGQEITENPPVLADAAAAERDSGSIIIVIATDAPLLPHQLKRLARRAALGLALTGSISGDASGDIFLAFSTANRALVGLQTGREATRTPLTMLPNARMNPLFEATVQATEEAIVNALVAAQTMTGVDGHRAMALAHERLRQVLGKYNRLARQPQQGASEQ